MWELLFQIGAGAVTLGQKVYAGIKRIVQVKRDNDLQEVTEINARVQAEAAADAEKGGHDPK